MTRVWILVLLTLLFACARSVVPDAVVVGPPTLRYDVTIFDNFGGAETRVCAEGFTPRQWVPMYGSASRGLLRAWTDAGELNVSGGRIAVPADSDAECLSYRTRFAGEMFQSTDESAIIVSQSQWLWRPLPFPEDAKAQLVLRLPDGARASVPFEPGGEGHQLERDAFFRDGYTVFGVFEEERFQVGDTDVTVALLGPSPSGDVVRRWLTTAIGAAASVGSEFPSPRVHFVIAPLEGTDRPVAFGMVRRGGGPSVLLLPSPTAAVEDLEIDWVAIHELSHIWLPRLKRDGRWLTEGIATYLQEVLRARCGLQSAEESWRRIRAGLARGERSGTGRTLARESREMSRTGAYHRVYWSGTAFAVEADMKLREASDQQTSLPRVIELARPQVLEMQGPVSAAELLAVFDDVAGTDFLVDLGAEYASRSAFPEIPMVDDDEMAGMRADIMAVDVARCGATGEASR
ncbi:MAG: hypothetical protein AAF500_18340 [Myxococcota bacterium]